MEAKRAIEAMSDSEIIIRAEDDGYEITTEQAREIRGAARRGCLIWTIDRITTTDRSRLDLRPVF